MSYTKGPWEIKKDRDGDIASIGPLVPEDFHETFYIECSHADALLASRAPDMYEAIKAYLADSDDRVPPIGDTTEVANLRKAIAGIE